MVICMQRRTNKKQKDDAVSPVVGVMLMLVVTIIIAAVVSMYASGLYSTQGKTPTASIDTTIKSDGSTSGMFYMKVISVSNAVATKDLKLVTSWTTPEKKDSETIEGTTYNKGDKIAVTNTVLPYNGTYNNTQYTTKMGTGTSYSFHSPIGWGPGVSGVLPTGTMKYTIDQYWGNYALTEGTTLRHTLSAAGGGAYASEGGAGSGADSMDAILGKGWWNLRPGDIVDVKLIYIPTNGLVYEKKVTVEA